MNNVHIRIILALAADDEVYLEDEKLREEYVLYDTGCVFVSGKRWRPWLFGQVKKIHNSSIWYLRVDYSNLNVFICVNFIVFLVYLFCVCLKTLLYYKRVSKFSVYFNTPASREK